MAEPVPGPSDERPGSRELEILLVNLPKAVARVARELYWLLREPSGELPRDISWALGGIRAIGPDDRQFEHEHIAEKANRVVYLRESAPLRAYLGLMIEVGEITTEEAREAVYVHKRVKGLEHLNGEAPEFIRYIERIHGRALEGKPLTSIDEAGIYVEIARERLDKRPPASYIRQLGGSPGTIEEAVLSFLDSEGADKYRAFVNEKSGLRPRPQAPRMRRQGSQ